MSTPRQLKVKLELTLPEHVDGWDNPTDYLYALLENECQGGGIEDYTVKRIESDLVKTEPPANRRVVR